MPNVVLYHPFQLNEVHIFVMDFEGLKNRHQLVDDR